MKMKRYYLVIILLGACGFNLYAQLIPNLGGQRVGISAFTFLELDVSPVSSAMGSAHISSSGDAYSTYWNPAAMVDLKKITIGTSDRVMPAGINLSYLSVICPTKKNGAWGFSLDGLNPGSMEKRTELQPNGTGQYFNANSFALGVSYSKLLTEQFSFGATTKLVREQLDYFSTTTAMIDMGFLYRTDFKDLKFTVMLQSFGTNSTVKGTFNVATFNPQDVTPTAYPTPTTFRMGFSLVPYKTMRENLKIEVQLNHPSDNAENISMGAEYAYDQIFFVRAGYIFNLVQQRLPTFGFGVKSRIGKHPLNIDYAAVAVNNFGLMHSIGLVLTINNAKRTDNEDSNRGNENE